jgi:hypothetical protein
MSDGSYNAWLAEKLKDTEAITRAIQKGVLNAVHEHIRAGQPMCSWQDGKVVWLPAEEVLRIIEREQNSSNDSQ